MHIDAQQQGTTLLLTISGDITIFEAELFHQALCRKLTPTQNSQKLILDLAKVGEFDTSGLQILISLQQTLSSLNISLSIIAASDSIRDLIDLMDQPKLLTEVADGS